MVPWQRRIERAEELARRCPYSAELMYFYRDIARFQATMHDQDLEPLRVLEGELGAFFQRLLNPAPLPTPCGHTPLIIHTDEEFPHIRIEACDTCRTYRKVVDLAQDPAAIPEVDDLASVPLDLWAVQQGYMKPTANLFGL